MTHPLPTPYLPKVQDLHLRHFGITPRICGNYAEAAEICFDRHYKSPQPLEVTLDGIPSTRWVSWNTPSARAKAGWKNADDATRDAAYGVCIAAVEDQCNLLAVERADTQTGADYYVSAQSQNDLEDALRLEVSGVDRGSASDVRKRLNKKKKQLLDANLNLPALAAVVGFKARLVALVEVV